MAYVLYFGLATNAQKTKLEWVKNMGTAFASTKVHHYIAIDKYKNVYTAGPLIGTIDLDPGPGVFTVSSKGDGDFFISKLSHDGNFIWGAAIGGVFNDFALGIDLDDDGNSYVCGYYTDSVDFDPGPGVYQLTATGQTDNFIMKFDTSGKLVWAKSIGGPNFEMGCNLKIDKAANVYLLGSYNGMVDFDPNSGVHNVPEPKGMYVLRLDVNGNFKWVKIVEGALGPDAVSVDDSCNIYIAGFYFNTVDFNRDTPSVIKTAKGNADMFITKWDSTGNYKWVKTAGGSDYELITALNVDKSGNIYTTGQFSSSTIDFDEGTGVSIKTCAGSSDIFLMKLNSAGALDWVYAFGGKSMDMGSGVIIDTAGDVYTAGFYSDKVDFDPGAGDATLIATKSIYDPGMNAYILKLNKAGKFEFVSEYKSLTLKGSCRIQELVMDKSGNIYTAGLYVDSTNFKDDGTPYILSDTSGFVLKMSPHSLSISDNSSLKNKTLELYPNPSTGQFSIKAEAELIGARVRIFNGMGKLQHSFLIEDVITESSLPSGFYIVEINQNGETINQKLIIY